MPDHYQVLGLARHAEAAVVKAAYRALVSLYHPDRNPAPDAIERIIGVYLAARSEGESFIDNVRRIGLAPS